MGEGLGLLGSQHRQRSTEAASKVGELAARERWLRSELARLRERLEQRSLRATLDGWVTGPVYHELIGRQVAAGQELMTVIDDKSVRFISLVPEESIVRVRPGQPASVEISGLPRRRFDVFKGAVVAVDKRPVVGEGQGRGRSSTRPTSTSPGPGSSAGASGSTCATACAAPPRSSIGRTSACCGPCSTSSWAGKSEPGREVTRVSEAKAPREQEDDGKGELKGFEIIVLSAPLQGFPVPIPGGCNSSNSGCSCNDDDSEDPREAG